MKSFFVKLYIISIFTLMLGCSSDDNPTNPNDPNDPNEPTGTVELFSVDFETDVSGWNGIPQQRMESDTSDWLDLVDAGTTWHQRASGTSIILDEGTIYVTSEHAYSGNKSLLFELQNGISSTIEPDQYSYSKSECSSAYNRMSAHSIRKFSLLDYTDGDVASISLMVKPIESIMSDRGASIDFRVLVSGAHGLIKDIKMNHTFMEANLGKWTEIIIDLTAYTSWENDINIIIEMISGDKSTYCWQFRRGIDYTSDVYLTGESSSCIVAIDDVKLKVIPTTGG